MKEFAFNGILGAIFLLGSTFLFLRIFRLGVNGYLLAFIVANVVSVMYLYYKVNIKSYIEFSQCNKFLLRNMIIYSLPLIPNMLSWWVTNISSRYIIAGYCGLGIAGLFAGASKIPALINVVSSVFQQAWQFASVKEYQESTKSEFYSRVFHYYSFFVTMSSAVILAILPYVSRFILKGEFYEAWIYTPLLLFSATLGCYSIFLEHFILLSRIIRKRCIPLCWELPLISYCVFVDPPDRYYRGFNCQCGQLCRDCRDAYPGFKAICFSHH